MNKIHIFTSFLILVLLSLVNPNQGLQAGIIEKDFNFGFSDVEPDVYINNIDNPSPIEVIQMEFSVIDDIDGDITNEIYIVFDNYTENINILGEWLVVFGVTDSGGLETTIAIHVKNIDVNSPTFEVEIQSSLEIPQYSHLTSNLPRIVAYDQYEGNITHKIEIAGLEYVDTDILGEYNLIYSVSDSSGNETIETFTVKVIDCTDPTIEGPSEIIKRSDTILDSTFFLQYFTAEDDHDGIVTNRLEVTSNSYNGNADIPGEYSVVIKVTDIQGNETRKTLKITVIKDMIPRLIIDNYHWVIDNNHRIIDDEFITILKGIDNLPNLTYIFTTSYDNYSESYSKLDLYRKSFMLQSSSGEEFDREITLEVVTSTQNIIDEAPGYIELNAKVIVGGVAIVGLFAIFIIGLIASKK